MVWQEVNSIVKYHWRETCDGQTLTNTPNIIKKLVMLDWFMLYLLHDGCVDSSMYIG